VAENIGELPARLPALRLAGILEVEPRPGSQLAAPNEGERQAGEAAVEDAIQLARRLGCPRLILDPGIVAVGGGERGPVDLGDLTFAWTSERATAQLARRKPYLDQALDAVCRSLHSLTRRFDDMAFALTCTRHVWSLGDPVALEAVFEDLPRARLGYWHDAAVAARRHELLGEEQGRALEKFSKLLCGISLGDSGNGRVYLAPGTGGVDYPLLGSYVLRSGHPLPAAVELDPAVDPGEIPGAHAFLDKFGL
jgi:sugar phosphate isomerase/epimerase